MSLPTLTPTSTQSAIILPVTGTHANVADACPMGVYTGSVEFITGAVKQVKYTYKRLGGDVLDIELTEENVYANYEEAVLEYSYIVNQHQAKNVIGSALGGETGSFNHKGETTDGPDGYALKYPKFSFETSFRIGDSFATEAGLGGTTPIYSASISTVAGRQDYDLQDIVEKMSIDGSDAGAAFSGSVGNKRIKIRKMYYISPQQMWRFYGYYGGLNVVGNFHNYGQYADDSSFQVIPAWQNKLQAISYEDHLYTRTSHYSFEIIDNKLRLYPKPTNVSPEKFWFRFTIEDGDIWTDTGAGQDGVNNINTLPFENIPFEKINSMGMQWIRRFSLALSKETLGQIRGKFGGSIPIPGDNISLNASDLLSQAKEEQTALKEELRKVLEETEYTKLIAADKEMTDNAVNIMNEAPMGIFVG
jgi:hypothetical protein|tara:strand:- start:18 stop:1271 length:1254 start_codon:yes stop_codon:yes gene_type:complete